MRCTVELITGALSSAAFGGPGASSQLLPIQRHDLEQFYSTLSHPHVVMECWSGRCRRAGSQWAEPGHIGHLWGSMLLVLLYLGSP